MKRTLYEHLPFLPWLIAETACLREYTGQEFTAGIVHPDDVAKYEALRKKMTHKQITAFGEYADQRCKAAYEAKAPWFMKIVRAKANAGRDQLYIFVTHWMTSWLQKNVK